MYVVFESWFKQDESPIKKAIGTGVMLITWSNTDKPGSLNYRKAQDGWLLMFLIMGGLAYGLSIGFGVTILAVGNLNYT